jgi:uncharacterized Zn finger protein (UPF0148 family)
MYSASCKLCGNRAHYDALPSVDKNGNHICPVCGGVLVFDIPVTAKPEPAATSVKTEKEAVKKVVKEDYFKSSTIEERSDN